MPCPQMPRPGRLLYSSTRTVSLSTTTRKERGSAVGASGAASASVPTPNAANSATAWRRLTSRALPHSSFAMITSIEIDVSHLTEQVRMGFAHRQRFGPVLQPQAQVAAIVADHAVDRVDVDD